jgi:hypothetical protein
MCKRDRQFRNFGYVANWVDGDPLGRRTGQKNLKRQVATTGLAVRWPPVLRRPDGCRIIPLKLYSLEAI